MCFLLVDVSSSHESVQGTIKGVHLLSITSRRRLWKVIESTLKMFFLQPGASYMYARIVLNSQRVDIPRYNQRTLSLILSLSNWDDPSPTPSAHLRRLWDKRQSDRLHLHQLCYYTKELKNLHSSLELQNFLYNQGTIKEGTFALYVVQRRRL